MFVASCGLLAKGEHRLLRAVETGQVPLTVAVDIANSGDAEVQNALQHAYENNLLRGRKLLIAKRLVEQRRSRGKGLSNKPSPRGQGDRCRLPHCFAHINRTLKRKA